MSAITDLINKTKKITEDENERLRKLFHSTYKNTKKEIGYLPMWRRNGSTDMARIIFDHEWRLILEVGEVVKIKNQYRERILAMGTEFGVALVYSHLDDDLGMVQYMVTPAFAAAWGRGYQKECPTQDWFTSKSPHFLDSEFFAHVAEIAEIEKEAGRTVGDGIPKYVKPAKKLNPVPARKKAAAAA